MNWREQLKRAVRGAIGEGFGQRLDYSLRRPHRRSSIYHPIYLPSLQGEYRPRVACVVDTSGSIGVRELTQALAEVRAVLQQLRVPITLSAALEEGRLPRFRAVVADETQDFGPTELMLLRALAEEGEDDLFLTLDPAQRIYRDPTSWRALLREMGVAEQGDYPQEALMYGRKVAYGQVIEFYKLNEVEQERGTTTPSSSPKARGTARPGARGGRPSWRPSSRQGFPSPAPGPCAQSEEAV